MLLKHTAPAARSPRARQAASAAGQPERVSFLKLYRFEPLERVEAIKQGVPAGMAVDLAKHMEITKERLYATLGLPRATVDRKLREGKTLSPDESARVLGMARLVGLAQTLVDESGKTQGFNAAAWVARWLEMPLAALNGRRPAELMDTAEGQAIVANRLERAQTGAYS